MQLILRQFFLIGKPPSNDKPAGEYPTVITNNGRNVLVVQDFWAGKYLGFLNVTFNADGDVESWNGDPILLDNSTLPGMYKMTYIDHICQTQQTDQINAICCSKWKTYLEKSLFFF